MRARLRRMCLSFAMLTGGPAEIEVEQESVVRVLVEDETRYALYAVKVTIMNTATKEINESRTDSSGRVVFEGLVPGDYVLKAGAQGFLDLEHPIKVSHGLPLVRLTLKLEEISEEVTITGGSRSADRTAAEQNADALNIDDDILRAVPVPLASQSLMNYIGTYLTGSAMGTDEVSILIDGVQSSALNIPLSAVRRILVNKNPYNAEYRRPGKARVEVLTMDGSRRHYHGTAGFSYGDSDLDARQAFATTKPPMTRRVSELSFSGPLFTNRASFLGTFEHHDEGRYNLVRAITPTGPFNAINQRPTGGSLAVSRIDWRATDSNRLTFRYDRAREWKQGSGVGGFRLPELAVNGDDNQDEFRFAWSSIFSPSVGNEFRVSLERKHNLDGKMPATYKYKVNGAFESGSNQDYTEGDADSLEIQNATTIYSGAHAFRFGGRARPKWIAMTDGSDFAGTFTFSSLDAYLAGRPFSFLSVEGSPTVAFTQHEFDLFFQDEVKVRPNLSLMLGARYDWQNSIRDNNNVSPRIALSYSAGPKTVIRAGSGTFYERLAEKVIERTNLYDGTLTKEIFISNPSYPDPHADGQSRLIAPSVYRLAPDLKTPHLIQHSVSYERQLWRDRTLFTVEYAHLRGVNLFRATDENAPPPGTARPRVAAQRPNPAFVKILQVNSNGTMKSNGLALSFRGRIGGWFKGNVFYLYSRSYNNTAGSEPGAGFPFQPPADNYNLANEWGRAAFDTRHRFNTSAVVELPRKVRIGAIVAAYSEVPYDITTGTDDNGDGLANDRPAGVTRNTGHGLPFKKVDVRLAKLFAVPGPFRERADLEFNVDVLNVFNTPNYSEVLGNMSSPFFGTPRGAGEPRLVQVLMRYSF